MVGPLMLLKMLHCKQISKNKSKLKRDSSGEGTSHCPAKEMKGFKVNVKSEPDDGICRVCLKEGDIYIYEPMANDIPEALNLFAGIDVNIEDAYPKFLCQSCYALLQGAIVFRQTAQKSDGILKQTVNPESFSQEDNDDIDDFDDDFFLSELQKLPKNEQVETQKYYFCKRCSMEFKSCEEYTNHKLSDEHDNFRLTCPICKNSYAAVYFKRHMSLHNKQKMETYMCDICGKNFTVKGQFSRHRVTHFYKLPYKCSLCPYKGRFSESLKMHMRTHTGEKPYQCTQCASRFINKSNLNKHMLTHKGEHDFKCDTCGRGFYTKRELDMHFKVDHTGIKDHICGVCGKAFGYRKAMMKHQLKVHKREKLKSGRMPLYLKVETMKRKGERVIIES